MFWVCGEALMDVFDAGASPTGQTLDARIGGSPLNVAIGLARLAHPVGFIGALGKGFLGERLLRALRDEGVDTGGIVRLDAPTTLGLVGLDAQGVADYAFYGEGGADRLLQAHHLPALPASVQALHFGSYAMVVEPTGSTLRSLAAQASSRCLVAYDINVRLNVVPDITRWTAAVDAMLPHTHLLKLSAEDAAHLFGHGFAEDRLRHWLTQGPAAVLMTDGANGLVLHAASGRLQVPAVPTALVDTVGAGDTIQAALLSGLADAGALRPDALRSLGNDGWSALLARATRAAAITCSRRGADLPRRHELAAG
jgi:fructokinase